MVRSCRVLQWGQSFQCSILAYIVKLNIWQLSQVQLDISCQPEVAEEMHRCLRTDELWVAGHRMGKNRDHMECSYEGNGVDEPQVVAGTQHEAAAMQVWSSASPQQLESQAGSGMPWTEP